ncbi:P1 family peptidase [Streptomyces oceani]|uniref:Aminopeptidase n=1 Tax=Streptomyces oceani TaxID=1075402 RepID=A0A1E7JZM1_9ACTN|nr:P1 family peptidase [Streptomyces oceani]OEU97046.1 aminopeptidase [Streptomyces oceani]
MPDKPNRPRARDLGLPLPPGEPGPDNALTDVPGVAVGHTTVTDPPRVHSGVTAIVPDGIGPAPAGVTLPAGLFAGNGYGKLVGATQLTELGQLESPIVLTSTLSVFRAADAVVSWLLERPEFAGVESFSPVVGECNDGHLSDIRARPVTAAHVREAIDGAHAGPVAEGCVGAGTGTRALGFKAGVGTASRRVELAGERFTLGLLVQANHGGTLRVGGMAVRPSEPAESPAADSGSPPPDNGSCMLVLATDAPLDARQLGRLARRAVFGLARTGAAYGNGSGDYGLAFSTRHEAPAPPDRLLDPLFEAALDLAEEGVLNALCAAVTTLGREGRTAEAVSPETWADRARRAARAEDRDRLAERRPGDGGT